MVDSFIGRLPALIVAAIVFVLFYGLSLFLTGVVRRATPRRRQNLGVVFAPVAGEPSGTGKKRHSGCESWSLAYL
jgi:hypothetical protein